MYIMYLEKNLVILVVKLYFFEFDGFLWYMEIIKIIEFVKCNGFVVYFYSRGVNLGYGGKEFYVLNCIVLDLSEFKRISYYKKLSGYIIVELGVL